MKKTHAAWSTVLITALLALTLAAAAASAGVRTVNIVMHDPGCHWFQVGSAYKTSLSVKGTTTFRNLDEATLIFKGNGLTKKVAVGKTLTIAKHGHYVITMVGQAPDDNHLKLTVS